MAARERGEIERLFATAFNAGDLASMLALYERTATLVPQLGQQVTGEQAIHQPLQGFLGTKAKMQVDTVYVLEAGDVALLRGQWRLTGTGPDSKPIDMTAKNVEVARRQPSGEWLLVIDHPFGAD